MVYLENKTESQNIWIPRMNEIIEIKKEEEDEE